MTPGRWAGSAQAYATSFGSLCAGTRDVVADAIGHDAEMVADIGCGTGELAVRLDRLARRVIAVDADPDMISSVPTGIARLRSALPHLALAERTCDAVVANFVVNHLPDPRAGVAELGRIAKPGAPVVMTIWPAGGASWQTMVADVFTTAKAAPMTAAHLAPELDFERSSSGLAAVARSAGLEIDEARDVTWTWRVPPEALWAGISGGIASMGARYVAQDDVTRARIRAAYLDVVSERLRTAGRDEHAGSARAEGDHGAATGAAERDDTLAFDVRAALVVARAR